jgi:AhpC/TSA family
MRTIGCGILTLTLVFSVSPSELICQDKKLTPAEQFQVLQQQYDRASGSGKPLTDAERLKFIGEVYKRRNALAHKFLMLAEQYPGDPIALDALMIAVWQVNSTPWTVELVGEDTAREKAFAILQRDHLKSDKLAPLCQRVSYGFCKEYETFLRSVAAQNPHKTVQATASLALGQFLNSRLERLDLCREQPTLAAEFGALYGKEYVADLLRQDHAAALREIEANFEQTSRQFGDVEVSGGVVRELVERELFAFRYLRVGKHAPDIQGEDQEGRRFKLSDYRGKVVLLDFWSFV